MYAVAWFGVLGPLEVTAAGRPVPVLGRSQRELLGALLLRANALVQVDFLVEDLWPDQPPPTARRQIQNTVGRLRRTLTGGGVPSETLETRPGGYLLRASRDELDLLSFHWHVEEGRRLAGAGRGAEAAARLRAGLALWRGTPLADLDGHFAVARARRLQEDRLAVLEECLALDLRLGRHHEVVGELAALVEEHPLREQPRALLMTALHRTGRTAEALEEYRRARTAFVAELGLEPGPELRELERSILTGTLDPPPEPSEPPAAAPPARRRPRQLPPDIADFTGRQELIGWLEELLADAGDSTAVVVAAIAGPAGVGKTALAVHVAHRLSGTFRDGQLYVDLGGGQARPAEPAEVLARFLRALGAHGSQIPKTLEERTEEYRSAVAGRRMLVVLDNAVDEAQVRPLVPGAPGCSVLVTSRSHLAGLPGARLVELSVLDSAQAVELLARIVSGDRVTPEPEAARELARLCGHLPLALRIAGARLVTRPDWPLSELAGRLTDERRRLDELAYSDLEVRAGLSVSLGRLSARARRLFGLLGHLYAPEFAAWVCAALLDTTAAGAAALIDELTDAQLLQPSGTGRGRYRLHDLVRLFARETGADDPGPALARAMGGWLALAGRAHIAVSGGDYATLHGGAPRWTSGLPDLPDDPLAWYDSERLNLIMAVDQAAAAGLDELCWDLVSSTYTLFLTRGHNDDWEETLKAALACTRRAGNARGTATMLMGLGLLGAYRHDYAEAAVVLEESVRTFRQIGEQQGLVYALGVAAHVDGMIGRYDEAVAFHEEALEAHRASGDLGAEVLLLRSLGQLLVEIGRLERARPHLERALVAGRGGDRRVHAEVLYWLGQLHLGAGEVDQAESDFKEMLAIAEDLADPREEAEARYGLGLVRLHTGALGAASGLFRQAMELNRPLGEPLTDGRIRTALALVHHRRREFRQAIGYLTEAIRIFDAIDTPLWQARSYRALGDVHAARGDRPAADAARARARDLFTRVGSPEATEV
ncbi:DNA-binding transcriptional activator of the SARP family [Nonomuraea solani]|uniref:DNA-binding transcriptional activator of the SARP family n=1 Tax=Nonomuraea solani TaxID=1144553 RepID=A0A1H6EZY3_9ACTN|nr:BTAD domain-containing putative transcriptional regulator [Nonomuraea solani]SEH03450.1 DNA-binding transcriptional activator of the SARP family [Nonomuraea solani]